LAASFHALRVAHGASGRLRCCVKLRLHNIDIVESSTESALNALMLSSIRHAVIVSQTNKYEVYTIPNEDFGRRNKR